jgi:hypothetical protein
MVGRGAPPAERREPGSSGILPGHDCLGAGRSAREARTEGASDADERARFERRVLRWLGALLVLAVGAALLGLL